MLRPTYHELDKKLAEARQAVADSRIRALSPGVLAADALELNYLLEELNLVLEEILTEASPDNYAGAHPPQRSYEDKIKDKELFAFQVNSHYFEKVVYLKFVLTDGYVWVVSLHNSRP